MTPYRLLAVTLSLALAIVACSPAAGTPTATTAPTAPYVGMYLKNFTVFNG